MAAKREPNPVDAALRDMNATTLRALVAHNDDVIAKAERPFDKHDSVRDKLFALMMQRIDVLQADRAAYQKIFLGLLQHPSRIRPVGTDVYASVKAMLRSAGAPHTPAYTSALAVAYVAVLAAWRNDTTADLSKTMKACDRALGLLENLASMRYIAPNI